jgi:lactam utilization protein B
MRIDINSDTGESFGAYAIGHDAGLFRSITSANVAAVFQAGDPSVLRDTIRLAKAHGVAVGAHPGFPDLVGFGRRELNVTAQEAEDLVLYQVAAVAGVAAAEGVRIQHVKPHGALFNMAVRNKDLAGAIATGGRLSIRRGDLPVGSGLRVAAEGRQSRVRAGRPAGAASRSGHQRRGCAHARVRMVKDARVRDHGFDRRVAADTSASMATRPAPTTSREDPRRPRSRRRHRR